MNYSILSFVLIIIPLAVILIVVLKKFPQLAVLDVDNVPEVKIAKKKDEALKKRVEEKATKSKNELIKKLIPVKENLKKVQDHFRKYVLRVTEQVEKEDQTLRRAQGKEKEPKDLSDKKQQSLFTLLREGDSARNHGDFETAEDKYITAIRIDSKNAEAYRGLADVYFKQEQIDEALETYKFILQLDSNDDEILVKLGDIYHKKGDVKSAIDYYQRAVLANDAYPHRFAKLAEMLDSIEQYETALSAIEQAVELEPNNPKYLDMMVEMAILSGDKDAAEDGYQKLRMANPENNKLESFRERISKM